MIYIAGPLSHTNPAVIRQRRDIAVAAYLELVTREIPAHCPHLSAYIPDAFELSHATWMVQCLAQLERCSAIWLLPGWEGSMGTMAEYGRAQEMYLPRYFSCRTVLLEWAHHPLGDNAFDVAFPPRHVEVG